MSRSPKDGGSYTFHRKDLDVPDATTVATPDAGFDRADLTTFCRLDELGLVVTGQRLEPDKAVLACRVVEPDQRCRRCGCQGTARNTVSRLLAHEPFGWRPATLLVTIRRYRFAECGHVWRQDMSKAAEPRARLSRRGLRWALEGIVCQHLTVARVAEGLAVSWNTANDAVLAESKRVLIDDPGRFDGVEVVGVDEHAWRHTRAGDKYVTVIVDLTPVREGTGPARLLDIAPGRSKQAFKTWSADRPQAWRETVEAVATGRVHRLQDRHHRGAARRGRGDGPLPRGPAGRRRPRPAPPPSPATHPRSPRPQGRPALPRAADPAHRRRPAHPRQQGRLEALFATDDHVEVEATWGIYQRMIAAYQEPDRTRGRQPVQRLIDSVSHGVPAALSEVLTLGRTLKKRAADVLAHFDRPGTSNGPTEAVNGRLEHLRGSALGLAQPHRLHHPKPARSRGFKPHLHPRL